MDATPDNRPVNDEVEARSPFWPPGHVDWACRTDSAELCPESPRLGIIHFLGWMTCVALAFSAFNSIMLMMERPQTESVVRTVFWGMYSVGIGTAWGALALWLARRYRGLPFPVFPGEYLWLVCGIEWLLWLIAMSLFVALSSSGIGVVGLLNGTMHLGVAIAFLVAAVKVRVKRWRVFLLVPAATSLLRLLASVLFPFSQHLFFLSLLIEIPVLAIVVLRDLLQRQRCPWSHWAGVAVRSYMMTLGFAHYVCHWLGLY